MSGEQVLRCGVIKQMHQFSYDRLAFHLADSSLRAFCRLPLGWTPARATSRASATDLAGRGSGGLGL